MKKVLVLLSLVVGCNLYGQKKLMIVANQIIAPVSPTMWGIFFEDINFGADGGLYAEMVKNRSFEFPMPMTGWKEVKNEATGRILIENASFASANARYAHVTFNSGKSDYGLSNEGFRGMGFQKGEVYTISFSARKLSGDAKVRVEAIDQAGRKIGETRIQNIGGEWSTYNSTIKTFDSSSKGRLNILFEGNGSIDIDKISLFPEKTWKGRPNGMRADLVQLLADMKPGFLRFPGGCIVEGRELTNRYQWKATVGPVDERKTMVNRWNMEFRHKPTPDYYQSFGLGFFEYFQLAEDIGAEPLPILNCGMACQFNSGEVVAMNQLDPYLQDALDLIEFANGDASTQWGQLRISMGHPSPFHLKYLGIGNEQWDEQYIERYKEFHTTLKQKYPEVRLVSSVGPSPEGRLFDYAWKELKTLSADIVDEHYYSSPQWFYQQVNRYDNYDRKGPKIFAGEYAAQSKGIARVDNQNNWQCALSEAAFMTGLERNGDVVQMASYAPLFAHADAWQWTPDLIWFDNVRSYGTPNYYVQKLFGVNKGTDLIKVLENNLPVDGKDSLYASSVLDRHTNEIVVKMVNASGRQASVEAMVTGATIIGKEGKMEVLRASDGEAVNSFDLPQAVAPITGKLVVKKNTVPVILQPYSLTVIRVPVKMGVNK